MDCTKSNPMPKDRDVMGQHWVHHSVRKVEGNTYECLACGQIMVGYRRPKSPYAYSTKRVAK